VGPTWPEPPGVTRGRLSGVVTKTTPCPIGRSGVAQPAQSGARALREAASAQVSWHGCYHHPSTPGALSRPWAVLGERRPSPTRVSGDHHLVWLDGTDTLQSHRPAPSPACAARTSPRSWAELPSSRYHPLAVKPHLVMSPRETGNGSHCPTAAAIRCQPAIGCCELPAAVPCGAQVRCSDHIPSPSGCGFSSASSLRVCFRRSLPPVERVPQK